MVTGQDNGALEDPGEALIGTARLRWPQIVAIGICVALNALDGFDVLSISFASPGIAAEWGIDRAALGIVLSMELFGMAAGSFLLGAVCDRWGRRPTILTCLVLMAAGMALAAFAGSVPMLSACRLLTGIGIGGMLAATNAAAAEYANFRLRSFAVAIMACGYPLGAVLGGTAASSLLVSHGWRAIFIFGACASAAFLPLAFLALPETVAFACRGRSADALARLNRALVRQGHAAVEALPPTPPLRPAGSIAQLFTPALARTTLCLTIAYVAQIMTFYFILKWTPKIVVDMGFAPSAAGGVLVWANVGGLTGALLFSLLTRSLSPRRLTIGVMLLSTALVALFGRANADLHQLGLLAAMAGFCTNGAMVGLYALLASAYPTRLRGIGTGFVIALGRGGAALSPIVAGLLFQRGVALPWVALAMGSGALVAAAALVAWRRGPTQPTLA